MLNLWMHLVGWLQEREKGQGLAEYALILFLIAIVCIVALTLLGTTISSVLASVANQM